MGIPIYTGNSDAILEMESKWEVQSQLGIKKQNDLVLWTFLVYIFMIYQKENKS